MVSLIAGFIASCFANKSGGSRFEIVNNAFDDLVLRISVVIIATIPISLSNWFWKFLCLHNGTLYEWGILNGWVVYVWQANISCKIELADIHIFFVHYTPSVRIIDIMVSHTIYVVCFNFIHKWWDLQSTPNDRFFLRNFSWQFYLLSEFLTEICWGEIPEEILFVFCFDVWPGVRTLALRLISQHSIYLTTAITGATKILATKMPVKNVLWKMKVWWLPY